MKSSNVTPLDAKLSSWGKEVKNMSKKTTQATRRLIQELRDLPQEDTLRKETAEYVAGIYLHRSERSGATNGKYQREVRRLLEKLR